MWILQNFLFLSQQLPLGPLALSSQRCVTERTWTRGSGGGGRSHWGKGSGALLSVFFCLLSVRCRTARPLTSCGNCLRQKNSSCFASYCHFIRPFWGGGVVLCWFGGSKPRCFKNISDMKQIKGNVRRPETKLLGTPHLGF